MITVKKEPTMPKTKAPTRTTRFNATSYRPHKIFLFREEDDRVNFEEIYSIKNPRHIEQALQMARVFQPAIDPQTLHLNLAKAIECVKAQEDMAIVKTLDQTIQQSEAKVTVMIDKLSALLENVVGIVLEGKTKEEYTAAITEAFTNLAVQEDDAWIFWEKKEGHKTTYQYNILFAVQNEQTGGVLMGLPISLKITVDREYERVLFITITDKETYSVQVQSLSVVQPLWQPSEAMLKRRNRVLNA